MSGRFPPPVRRLVRVVVGLGASGGLIALAGVLGFVGLWTFAGFKTTPGAPARGLVMLGAALSSLFVAGMALAWGLTQRRLIETRAFGAAFAAVGLAVTIWFTSAN